VVISEAFGGPRPIYKGLYTNGEGGDQGIFLFHVDGNIAKCLRCSTSLCTRIVLHFFSFFMLCSYVILAMQILGANSCGSYRLEDNFNKASHYQKK
jgi:hypothetical protein